MRAILWVTPASSPYKMAATSYEKYSKSHPLDAPFDNSVHECASSLIRVLPVKPGFGLAQVAQQHMRHQVDADAAKHHGQHIQRDGQLGDEHRVVCQRRRVLGYSRQ